MTMRAGSGSRLPGVARERDWAEFCGGSRFSGSPSRRNPGNRRRASRRRLRRCCGRGRPGRRLSDGQGRPPHPGTVTGRDARPTRERLGYARGRVVALLDDPPAGVVVVLDEIAGLDAVDAAGVRAGHDADAAVIHLLADPPVQAVVLVRGHGRLGVDPPPGGHEPVPGVVGVEQDAVVGQVAGVVGDAAARLAACRPNTLVTEQWHTLAFF